jgi:DNA (cytosine-5)-methyltransferase 1
MGFDIRKMRVETRASQAQLSEIANIPQYRLSNLELGKDTPTYSEMVKIKLVVEQILHGDIELRKKKRISKELFDYSIVDVNPRRGYTQTPRNAEYLAQLTELERNFKKDHSQDPTAISFFAGCGGLCYGITAAGFNIVASNELVEDYREIYKQNFPNARFLSNDIRDISESEIDHLIEEYPDIDLFAGGPPCQGFSLAGKRDVEDQRNTLFQYYLRIANRVRPKVILMENVRLLTSMKTPEGKFVKDEIIKTFNEIGYSGQFFIVNASDYGVAQNRERVLFIGVRKDLNMKPDMLPPLCGEGGDLFSTHIPKFTFGDAVSDLEYLESGEASANDKFHKATHHPEHVIRWLYDVPQGKSAHDNDNPNLRPPSGYNTTYKRQIWTEPGCTVTTNFNMISGGNNVHPIATRALTIREALRLQSFPDSFKFKGKDGSIRTTIGNAVPPLMAFHVAKYLRKVYKLSKS